jgi:hypothetical protein
MVTAGWGGGEWARGVWGWGGGGGRGGTMRHGERQRPPTVAISSLRLAVRRESRAAAASAASATCCMAAARARPAASDRRTCAAENLSTTALAWSVRASARPSTPEHTPWTRTHSTHKTAPSPAPRRGGSSAPTCGYRGDRFTPSHTHERSHKHTCSELWEHGLPRWGGGSSATPPVPPSPYPGVTHKHISALSIAHPPPTTRALKDASQRASASVLCLRCLHRWRPGIRHRTPPPFRSLPQSLERGGRWSAGVPLGQARTAGSPRRSGLRPDHAAGPSGC